jgi:rhodanese-related sulfurtransferase
LSSIRSHATLTALAVSLAFTMPGSGRAEGSATNSTAVAVSLETIEAAALARRIASGEVLLIDVRSPEEFAEGHLAGAINLPLDSFDPAALPKAQGKQTVLYCRSGRRSAMVAQRIAATGEAPPPQLEGGILAWQAKGLPLETPAR